jgi:hypothetical protein|nr:MAG TPA: transcription factor [Bacteriophage sp.]
MTYSEIVNKVSDDTGIPRYIVARTYKAYWRFIYESIKELPLKNDITEEEFSKLKTNFNIPSLGKLSCTYNRMIGVKKRFKYIKELREKKDAES